LLSFEKSQVQRIQKEKGHFHAPQKTKTEKAMASLFALKKNIYYIFFKLKKKQE